MTDELEVRWRRIRGRPEAVGSGTGLIGLHGVAQAERLLTHLILTAEDGDALEIEAGPPGKLALGI